VLFEGSARDRFGVYGLVASVQSFVRFKGKEARGICV
jgi:hypothetical protein